LLRRAPGSGVYLNSSSEKARYKICLAYDNDMDIVNEPSLAEQLRQFELEVSKRGGLAVSTPFSCSDEMPKAVKSSDGLVLFGSVYPDWLPKDKPMVILFDPESFIENASYVLSDEYLNGMIAARYVYSLGHSKCVFIGDTERYFWARDRYRALCDAAAEAGKPKPELLTNKKNAPIHSDIAKAVKSLGSTVAVCANDYIAMGLISALHRVGLHVPEDVSVVGYDDVAAASYFHPTLTTIRLPVEEAVYVAVNEFDNMILKSDKHIPKRITLLGKLVTRESCAPPTRK
jgi:DNA-binding LacI/PurR family transcriptional regulator